MKKILENSFLTWLVLTAIIVVVMFILGNSVWSRRFSGIIMFLFMVIPVRDWINKLFDWLIDYVASNNDKIKAKLLILFAYNLLTGDPKKKDINEPMYKILHVLVGIICVIFGLIFMIVKKLSYTIVLTWLETAEYLIRGMISAGAILTFILLTIASIVVIGLFVKMILEEKVKNATLFPALFFGIIVVNIFIDKFLLRWSWETLWVKIVAWFFIMIIPFIVLLILSIKDMKNNNSGTNTNGRP